ncbi:MAG: radical SAM protein [Bacillus subtilis]|nr:radical SAM protein [Bacillus subtilis]
MIKTCNIQCNYCNRKYSCPNENRPGVTNELIKPENVHQIISESLIKFPNLKIAGIAGPGEALAEPETIYKSFKTVKENFPQLKLCLSSNGVKIAESIDLIKELGIDYVTVTINTLNPLTASKIYNDKKPDIIVKKQMQGVKELQNIGVTVKINSVVIPEINYQDLTEVAKFAKDNKIFAQNLIPFFPVQGSAFENLKAPSKEQMQIIREECSKYINQITHCKRCRADAIGTLE